MIDSEEDTEVFLKKAQDIEMAKENQQVEQMAVGKEITNHDLSAHLSALITDTHATAMRKLEAVESKLTSVEKKYTALDL